MARTCLRCRMYRAYLEDRAGMVVRRCLFPSAEVQRRIKHPYGKRSDLERALLGNERSLSYCFAGEDLVVCSPSRSLRNPDHHDGRSGRKGMADNRSRDCGIACCPPRAERRVAQDRSLNVPSQYVLVDVAHGRVCYTLSQKTQRLRGV